MFIRDEVDDSIKERNMAGKNFGKKLTLLREEKGWTRSILARRLNVSPTAVFNWEEEGTIPRSETRAKLARLFNVNDDMTPRSQGESSGTSIGSELQLVLKEAEVRCAELLKITPDDLSISLRINKPNPSDDW